MKSFKLRQKIYFSLFILTSIILVGIAGFMVIEDFPFVDALYMTVITVTTVGFKEVHALGDSGKLFTTFLILTSFGTFAYAISVITRAVMSGEFRDIYKDNKVTKELNKLKGHVIICGYGRNGKQAVKKLKVYKQPYLVIEKDPETLLRLREEKTTLFIDGDATEDDVLEKAGVERAKALITTLSKDADNLFVVLSARHKNPLLTIISRAIHESSNYKLKTAGANNVIMPDKVGGAHMAALVTTPDVVEFLDSISVEGSAAINLEAINVNEIPPDYKFKTLSDLNLRQMTGCTVIGYKTTAGEYMINPGGETELLPNSKLFVLGRPDQIKNLNAFFDMKPNTEKKT